MNKKIKINIPLFGSFANVWTELSMPDLTKNVPDMLNINVSIENITVQELSNNVFSKTKIQCNSAVKQNHGSKETF